METRVLRFIPNTPALTAWGQKPGTSHLLDWINNQTKGNILNSNKRCITHMNKDSAYRITNASLLKSYIPGTFIRYKTGTLQDTLIINFGGAMLLSLRWSFLDQLHSV